MHVGIIIWIGLFYTSETLLQQRMLIGIGNEGMKKRKEIILFPLEKTGCDMNENWREKQEIPSVL